MDTTPNSIVPNIASFRSQVLGSLFGTSQDGSGDIFSALLSQQTALGKGATVSSDPAAAALSPTGRNPLLPDPESAYKMMSLINSRDVLYQAQFAEMSDMQSQVTQMRSAGASLGGIGVATPDGDIRAQLQGFVDQYNGWIQRFGADVQKGGLLAGTQAAQVSLHELQASVKNPFNGAAAGMHGLGDLGITIDPASGLASLDASRLDAVLSRDKQAAVDTLQAFAANFSKSAGLLNASDNFIPRQLDNLHRAIEYIATNKDDLQAAFGTGDPAQPTGQVARALAAYKQTLSA